MSQTNYVQAPVPCFQPFQNKLPSGLQKQAGLTNDELPPIEISPHMSRSFPTLRADAHLIGLEHPDGPVSPIHTQFT